MTALTALTAVAAAGKARSAPLPDATAPRDAGEPIMAIVSIKSQQVTFYDADGWILRAPVSTGITGRETPAGVFAVLEKDKDHHSSLYDDAWMPNMQRLTWNGIALHGGPLPGYAASHGCVRMPYGFAEELFDKTWIGMRVIISPNDAEPVEFSHPALFVPNREAIAAAPAKAEALAREAAEAAKTADEAKKAAANRYVGNLAPMPGVYPDYKAPIVRNGAEGRELVTARWGMPSSQHALMEATKKRAAKLEAKGKFVDFRELLRMEPDGGTTNIRNVKSKHWTRWLGAENRCVVPFNSFSEFNKAEGGDIWFALDETRPLACFAGI